MSAPTAYYPAYNFTQFQVSHPSTPLPAASLDAELFSVSSSVTQIINNLNMIQRADGALANGSVGMQQLATSLFTGVNAATPWLTATAYAKQSSVYQGNAVYLCLVSHTSGVFATDLAAGKWTAILDFSTSVNAAAASATAAAASATAAAASASNLQGTSATSVTIGSGSQSFTTQAGKFFNVGNNVTITSNANPTVNFMNGVVTSYSGTALVVNVNAFGGSGAHTDWTISVSGAVGATGATGAPGAGTGDMLKANNLSELANFATARTNIGLGSAAVQAASFFAQVANNLSDVANAATAFANIKQTGTSGATGALQLATTGEATSGVDTAKAVTAAGVAAYVAAHAAPPLTGTWTPTDNSGAGLSLTVASATYTKVGRLTFVQTALTYPATGSGVNASIAGLPFTSAGNIYAAAVACSYGTAIMGFINAGGTLLNFNTQAGIVAVTNSNLSSKQLYISMVYEASS